MTLDAANHAVHTEHGIRYLQMANTLAVPGDGRRSPNEMVTDLMLLANA